MKLNNQLTLQRLIGKIDNDFNISESDWIPRVAAWTIDALSQMKVLPMERKRRNLEVSDRIAQFPCTINAEEIRVFDSNGIEIPAFDREKDCKCPKSTIPSTGEQIAITNPKAPNGWETTQVADIVNPNGRNFILDCNNIDLSFDTDSITVETFEVATYHDDYLSRGSKHPVYDLKSPNPAINPFTQWNTLRPKAAASVKGKLANTEGWNNFFYNSTFLPRG